MHISIGAKRGRDGATRVSWLVYRCRLHGCPRLFAYMSLDLCIGVDCMGASDSAYLLDEVPADAADDLEEVVVVESLLLVHPERHVLVARRVLAEGRELVDLARLVVRQTSEARG